MFLARSCTAASCGPDQTCSENGCTSVVVDVESLEEIEPGDELGHPRPSKDGGTESDSGVADSGADSGVTDSGADSGTTDAGRPDGGDSGVVTGCTVPGDCEIDQECVESNGAECSGGSCECKATCAALTPVQTCGPEQECFYRIDLEGVCLDRDLHPGANFRAPCEQQDDCDGFENWYCRNRGDGSQGECTSLCIDDQFCSQRVPGTFCDFSVFGFEPYGECLEPPPPVGDVGFACNKMAGCQSICLLEFGMCSSSCSGLTACPSNSICAIATNSVEAFCALTCVTDGDCIDNPNFVCRDDYGFDDSGVCFFRCDNTQFPCGPGLACDPVTGHCI
jgi:hypothetical protein